MTCSAQVIAENVKAGFQHGSIYCIGNHSATGFGPKDRHRLIAVLKVEQRKPHVQILSNIKILFLLQLE